MAKINREVLAALIDTVEDYLDSKRVKIPNEDRDAEDSDNTANIYGEDYDMLEQSFMAVLKEAGVEVDYSYDKVDETLLGEVATSAGVLKAYKSADPGQPGIAVMLQPAGYDTEIDMSYVSVYEDTEYQTSYKETSVDVSIMTYGNVFTEDYTDKVMIRRKDVMDALKGEEKNVKPDVVLQ